MSEQANRSNTVVSSLTAGLVNGFTQVIVAISLASLVFAGPLDAFLPRGIAMALVTSVTIILVTTLFASSPEVLGSIQDNTAVLLSVVTASLVVSVPASQLLPTVVTVILVSTLLTGGFLVLLGYFRLGGLVRYIPYPVIGGFLAGTGWLIVQGSFSTMADFPLTPATVAALLQGEQIRLWAPGVVLGLVLFFGVRRTKNTLALPGILVAGFALFFLWLFLTGLSIDEAIEQGLLLGEIGREALWQPFSIQDLAQADWAAVLAQGGNIASILVLTAISLLLNVSGIELALGKDMDLNRELRITGFANLLSGLAGGTIGYHALSFTVLSRRLGSRGRLTGFLTVGICLSVMIVGASALTFVPRAVLGALLLFLGLDFLYEWVIEGYRKLGRLDYAVVLLILVIIATTGFLVGVTVGLVLMVVLFVINYSRTNIFHQILSGSSLTSNVERSGTHRRALLRLGEEICILQLQGFIFFGTANAVLEQVRELVTDSASRLQFVVLDFSRVSGLDSSAAFSFSKLQQLAAAEGIVLVLTNLMEDAKQALLRSGLDGEGAQFFVDLDHGLEWCEERLLARHHVNDYDEGASLEWDWSEAGLSENQITRLQSYLGKEIFEPGAYLIYQGDEPDSLFFIEAGRVSVYLEPTTTDGQRMRVLSLTRGTVVGELGFYLHNPRSASVIADIETTAYELSRNKLREMSSKDPDLAILFNQLMLRLVAERLVIANRRIEALRRYS